MLKRTFTFTDFDGNERKEDHYFNLMESEILDMQLEVPGGLMSLIEQISQAQDVPELMRLFKIIIKKSYGKKSPDGRRFIKSDEIFSEFESTEAYSQLFMELLTDGEAGAAFIKGILPKNRTNPQAVAPAK